jgi:non-specific serine/threonine protein kinase
VHPERIGRYAIVRLIGQGGMGVVYEGHDDRLDRQVAIKIIRGEVVADPTIHERFRREARAAARVSHPYICALYEYDEAAGQPFLVMELLSGEPLSKRLERGALPWSEVLRLADQLLDALNALHSNGIVHRDLKPANVFLTPHGAKLVDFGLAQPTAFDDATHLGLTGAGMIVGTPQYMPPERTTGHPADERADLWAAAAVLYEAAAGAPAFSGRTFAELVHAVGYDEPAPLAGTTLSAFDRALRPAFEKDPQQRIASAAALSGRIRDAASASTGTTQQATTASQFGNSTGKGAGTSGEGRAADSGGAPATTTRFVALPLRVLRADPDTDFLAFSIPDAVSSALAGLPGVTVRAPRALPGGETDARAIGRDWAVDVVLAGTLMRAGSMVRVSAQLIDAADGTMRWSDTAQAPLEDLFGLQDELTSKIVSSLRLPLSGSDRQALARQAPAHPEAYALYMRANQLMTEASHWQDARALYEQALAIDPAYAPAWAGLGRARRVLAKWASERGSGLALAQSAFAQALRLDPDLSTVYEQLVYVDLELGLAAETMARLLERAAAHPRDAGVMAGLVTACRYAGLYDASLAAHAKAMAIDAATPTTVTWTHFHLGNYPAAIHSDHGTPPFCSLASRLITGAIEPDHIKAMEGAVPEGGLRVALRLYRELAQGHVEAGLEDLRRMVANGFADPEGWFLAGAFLARAGANAHALEWLTRAVDAGFAGHRPLVERDHFDRLRGSAEFERLIDRAKARVVHARHIYERARGPAVLSPRLT